MTPPITAWIARDKDDQLWIYRTKPHKESPKYDFWDNGTLQYFEIDPALFPSVQWEDEEPTEVELTIKPKEQKDA